MRKHFGALRVLLILLFLIPAPAHAESAKGAIETQVHRVLEVLRNPAENKAEKEKKISALAEGIFDYTELSRLSLANYWRAFTPEQRTEFTGLFGKLLADVYMDRIMQYTNEKIVFGKESVLSENTVEIRSDIVTQDRSIPMAYRMILEKGEWKIYDVVIEGVSLVMNYRNQFREILVNKSPEDLLKMLRDKVRNWKGN